MIDHPMVTFGLNRLRETRPETGHISAQDVLDVLHKHLKIENSADRLAEISMLLGERRDVLQRTHGDDRWILHTEIQIRRPQRHA
jgi:hypothetical protein